MRRLGITVPVAARAPSPTPAPAADGCRREAPSPAAPRHGPLSLASDASGRLTSVSPDIAELTGCPGAAALPGRSWAESDRPQPDRPGWRPQPAPSARRRDLERPSRALAHRHAAGEGAPCRDVRRAGPRCGAPDAGFRGFGLARLTEREPFPDAGRRRARTDRGESRKTLLAAETICLQLRQRPSRASRLRWLA
jgi:hypothetical protein